MRDVRTDLDDLVLDADAVLDLSDTERDRRGKELLQSIRQRLSRQER